jgi:hypothetical protein
MNSSLIPLKRINKLNLISLANSIKSTKNNQTCMISSSSNLKSNQDTVDKAENASEKSVFLENLEYCSIFIIFN